MVVLQAGSSRTRSDSKEMPPSMVLDRDAK